MSGLALRACTHVTENRTEYLRDWRGALTDSVNTLGKEALFESFFLTYLWG